MRKINASPFRAKFIEAIALIISSLAYVLIISWTLNLRIIQPAFQQLEKRQGLEDIGRVRATIKNEFPSLTLLTQDWGDWDETYKFSQNHNQEYLEANVPSLTTLSKSTKIDFLALYDLNAIELFKGAYHPDMEREVNLHSTPSIRSLVASVLKTNREKKGLFKTDEGLLALVARPILTSEGRGPSHGVIIMGRFLSQLLLSSVGKKCPIPFELFIQDDKRLSAPEKALFAKLSATAPRFTPVFHQGFVYQTYPDIEEEAVLLLRTPLRDHITSLGRQTGYILLATLGSIALALLTFLAGYRMQQKISVQELQESEIRYRTLFENKHTIMLLVDPESRAITDANPAACNYYGFNHKKMLKLKIDQINAVPTEDTWARIDLIRLGKQKHFITRHSQADGTIRDVEIYCEPISLNGRALLFSIVHDITTRLQAEVELAQLEAQSRQLHKSEGLSRMAGAVAHLFNNQLTVVLGNLEMVIDEEAEGRSREMLIMAKQAARRVSETSGMMLTYLGQHSETLEPCPLSDICQHYLTELQANTPSNIAIRTDLIFPSPLIHGNAKQLKQVLSYLTTNSAEAIAEDWGEISLTTSIVETSDIPQEYLIPRDITFTSGTLACLQIRDTGCGMTKKSLERIFDPFFTTQFPGRGLGLPVVLGIIRSWGGWIGVESKHNQGSTFRLYLPLSKGKE
ncbi:CHASE4 domain-containing protein [Desulfotalea psychrophila]|uniref:CHASE4 domain-containing protein n=1 Tax=Desulfotalea psychrophila TaxID=84980 RepID=UPI001389F910|nr:CHASE4 domain-containing protein [Desulfotalea psychrophila]